MDYTSLTSTYCYSTQVSSIVRVEGEQKSLFLGWVMLSSEVNCTAWKRAGLAKSRWDSPGSLVLRSY